MMVNLPCLQGSRPNFLRPTCSYTEYQLSFQTGSMPYGGYSCRLQLLFMFDYSLTWPVPYSTDSVDATLCLPLVGLLMTGIPFPRLLRVPFQNPAQYQTFLQLSRILEFFFSDLFVYAAAVRSVSAALLHRQTGKCLPSPQGSRKGSYLRSPVSPVCFLHAVSPGISHSVCFLFL